MQSTLKTKPAGSSPHPSPSSHGGRQASHSLAPSQQRGSLTSLRIRSLSARSLTHVLQNASELSRFPRSVSDAPLAPSPSLALLSTQGGSKEHFLVLSDAAASHPGIWGPQNIPCDIKTHLGKGWRQVAMDGWGRVQPHWVPCSPRPQPPCCRSAAGAGTLRSGSMAVSRLTNNLQPGMSTTINSPISTDLKKDALVFTRLIVASPKPQAGALSAGGAGEANAGPTLHALYFSTTRTHSPLISPAPSPRRRVSRVQVDTAPHPPETSSLKSP